MKTLVVDDDFVSRKMLQQILTFYGECDVAVNGKEAVEAFLYANEQSMPYDLICLDVMMPEMDGHAALKEIRAWEAEHAEVEPVKVMMTTALAEQEHIMKAIEGKCAAYLIKPFDKKILRRKLQAMGLLSGLRVFS